MRQSKFTETQIVSILKEADAGRPVNSSVYLWEAIEGLVQTRTGSHRESR